MPRDSNTVVVDNRGDMDAVSFESLGSVIEKGAHKRVTETYLVERLNSSLNINLVDEEKHHSPGMKLLKRRTSNES